MTRSALSRAWLDRCNPMAATIATAIAQGHGVPEVLARVLAGIGARRRRALVGARLRTAITEVATDQLVEPVRGVLDRHRETRERLEDARLA